MEKTKRKIVVGGGAGYIGSALVPALVEKGYEVEVIDLLWFGNNLPPEVKVVHKDLFTCQEEDLKGTDTFIFLAGLSNDPMAEYKPSDNFIYNGALPSYMAYLAMRAGVRRFIYASSCSVYGFTDSQLFDEESPTNSLYPYGVSKLQGERGVMQMQTNDFSVIAPRQGTVCGPSPRLRFDLIINTMLKHALSTETITVNNPDIWRPILDVRDAVSFYLQAIEAPDNVSGVFNVLSVNHTVAEVAEAVKKIVESMTDKKIKIETKQLPDLRNYRVSHEKAKQVLGFIPQYKVHDTVEHLYHHIKDLPDWENDNYYNIRVFKKHG